MNDSIREYIATRIKKPQFDVPRWEASAPVVGVDTINFNFGNTYQGVYLFALFVTNAGVVGTINDAKGQPLVNSNAGGMQSVDFEYVMFERRLILTSSALTLAFSVGFQLITSGEAV